jgi:hypothetical protein
LQRFFESIEEFDDPFFIGARRERPMLSSTTFVQEPDYTAFRKTPLPIQALGSVYDGRDPYATSLGVVLLVLENNYAREIYAPHGSRIENGKIAYTHDLDTARYVTKRNGFEEAQLRLAEGPVSDEAKSLLRSFFEMQNTREMNGKYVIQVCG